MKNLNTIAILAGGFGTRLKERTGNLPKCMVQINGEPLLSHQIKQCKKYGFNKIALLLHYGHTEIINFYGNGDQYGVDIEYVIEDSPLGTAGAILSALPIMAENFLVIYGDTFFDINLQRLLSEHISKQVTGTLFLHPNDHPYDSDIVELDEFNYVKKIHPYPHEENFSHRNLVNAALYAFTKNDLQKFSLEGYPRDIAKDLFPYIIARGSKLFGYKTPEYIKDIGTPERIDKAQSDIECGIVESRSARKLRPAIFLDRDGCINEEVGRITKISDIQLINGSGEAIALINQSKYLAIAVTNQPVIARGEISTKELDSINGELEMLLGKKHAYLDSLYICPHHPDSGFTGEIKQLKINCDCRKPKTGLIDKAANDLRVDRSQSWMIGDMTTDIEAGHKAGLKTILLKTGHSGTDNLSQTSPNYHCQNLMDAIEWILHGHPNTLKKITQIISQIMGNRFALVGGLSRSGKSHFSRTLQEVSQSLFRNTHVIPLDSWLYPAKIRENRKGVLSRYNIPEIENIIEKLALTTTRVELAIPRFDRLSGEPKLDDVISIGPEDFIIFEGVPALCISERLLSKTSAKIFKIEDEKIRTDRIFAEYEWRNKSKEQIATIILTRDQDELPVILASKIHADVII